MQLVSDLQQRPNKGRLSVEKNIIPFFDLCSLVQIVCFIIHTVQTVLSAKVTFKNYIMVKNNFELLPTLLYKTSNCTYSTVRNIYAFENVNMTFTPSNVNDVFVDHAIQMRAAVFVMPIAVLLGALNRGCVENNVFVIKWRNFFIWKDIFSATELLILAYVIQIGVAMQEPGALLRGYLRHCGCKSSSYMPFVNSVPLFLQAAVGFFCYFVSGVIYLINALPKYGVMTPAEIQEYKEWLRKRNAEIAQSQQLIEQAKAAQAQLQMMRAAQYMHDPQNKVSGGLPQLPPGMAMIGPDGSPILPPHMMTSNNAVTRDSLQRSQMGADLMRASAGLPPAQTLSRGGALASVPQMDNLQMQLYLMQLQREQKKLLSQAPHSFTPSREAAMTTGRGVAASPPPVAPVGVGVTQPPPPPFQQQQTFQSSPYPQPPQQQSFQPQQSLPQPQQQLFPGQASATYPNPTYYPPPPQ